MDFFKVNKNEIEIPKKQKKANRASRSRGSETIIETQTWIIFYARSARGEIT